MAPRLPNRNPRTRSDKSRSQHGEAEGYEADGDRCKGTEQPEGLQDRIETIFAAEAPHGRLRNARQGFSRGFPHHVEDHGPSHHFRSISSACGAASAAAAYPRIEPAEDGALTGFEGVSNGSTSTGTV